MLNKVGKNPLVSIIMPFFNGELFIRESIESVMNQTYHNWELLLVDDGSSDKSTQIAKDFVGHYPENIYYYDHNDHHNLGVPVSRNLGLRHAKGKYVAFLDSDDVWLPHYLERQIADLESFPEAGMVYGPAKIWHGWTGKLEDMNCDRIQELAIKPDTLYRPLHLLSHFIRNKGATPCPSASLLRRSVIEQLGGMEEAFSLYEDQALFAKVCIESPIFVSGQCIMKYRRHPQSLCVIGDNTRQSYTERHAFLRWLEAYLSEIKIRDIHLLATLKQELFPYRHPTLYQLIKKKGVKSFMSSMISLATPKPLKREIRKYFHFLAILKARVRLTLKPEALSTKWGFDRGLPIHRFYLEQFLKEYSSDIQGHCLEFQGDSYTTRFGGAGVTKLDILHIDDSNPKATIIADLTQPNEIPDNSFNCIICTHVLHMIFDFNKAITEIHRILKPGGILLVAVPHISMCGENTHEIWRFTPEGLQMALARVFGKVNVGINAYGNSLTAAGELRGLVAHEFTKRELRCHDLRFAIEVCARASKKT